MLNIIRGEAGAGKSREIMKRINNDVLSGKEVYAIVPDRFNFEYNRILYGFMGVCNFNRMEVISFARAASYIFIKCGGLKGKYADDTVRRIIMYRTLVRLRKEGSLEYYGRQAENTRFVSDALEIVKTVSMAGLTPEQFAQRIPLLDERILSKAKDISVIYSGYINELEARGYKDGGTDLSEAAKRAAESGFFKGKNIYIDEFKSFTPDERELLNVMIRGCDSVTVALTAESGTAPDSLLFETVNKTAARLKLMAGDADVSVSEDFLPDVHRFENPELAFLSRSVLRPRKNTFNGECKNVKIYQAADFYAEADFVSAEICRLVREKGYKYSDIAVTSRCPENYSSIIEAAFARSDISLYTDVCEGIAHKSMVIFLRTALKLVSARRFSVEDILRYIKTGFAGLDENEIDILESYCYKWSVEGDMWTKPFRINSPCDETAEEIRAKVVTPLTEFKEKAACKRADGICRAFYEFIEAADIAGTVERLAEDCEDDDLLLAAREAKQLWDILSDTLMSFYRTLGGSEITISDFAELFDAAIVGMKLSSPPKKLDCVSFTAAHTSRFCNPRAVFVMGAYEGAFPLSASASPLFSDKDNELLRAADIDIGGSSRERVSDERFTVYSVLSCARERVYISVPAADISGGALYPSSSVNRINEMFGGIKITESDLDLAFFCTTEQNGCYQYIRTFRRNSVETASLRAALESFSPSNKPRLSIADSPVRTSHKLKKSTAEQIYGKHLVLSASRLEDYKKCPFMYFCKKGLKIYPRDRIDLSAVSIGNAVHYCLCEILKNTPKAQLISMDRAALLSEVKTKLNDYLQTKEFGGSYGKTGSFFAAYKRLSETAADILCKIKTEFAQSEFAADSFEYKISLDAKADQKASTISLPGGVSVTFVGSVDRIDTFKSGNDIYVRVVDYKTGEKIFSLGEIYYGINMQMLLYLFAVTDPNAAGKYRGCEPAGVLYMHAADYAPVLGRDAAEGDDETLKKSGCKMDGFVLDKSEIVEAMEPSVQSVYIPVKIKADGSYSAASKLISSEKMKELRRYTNDLIVSAAEEIYGGRIDAVPLVAGKSSPCSYCDYKAICGNYPAVARIEFDKEKVAKLNDDFYETTARKETEKTKKAAGKNAKTEGK